MSRAKELRECVECGYRAVTTRNAHRINGIRCGNMRLVNRVKNTWTLGDRRSRGISSLSMDHSHPLVPAPPKVPEEVE